MQESVTRRVGWWGRLGAGSKRAANHHRRLLRHYSSFLQIAPFPARCPPLAPTTILTMPKRATAPSRNTSDTSDTSDTGDTGDTSNTSNTSNTSDTIAREPLARDREGGGGGGGGVGHLKADMHVRAKSENDGVWRFCPSISGSRGCTSTFMTGSKCGEGHERLAWKQHLRRRATDREPPRFCFLLLTSEHERM